MKMNPCKNIDKLINNFYIFSCFYQIKIEIKTVYKHLNKSNFYTFFQLGLFQFVNHWTISSICKQQLPFLSLHLYCSHIQNTCFPIHFMQKRREFYKTERGEMVKNRYKEIAKTRVRQEKDEIEWKPLGIQRSFTFGY